MAPQSGGVDCFLRYLLCIGLLAIGQLDQSLGIGLMLEKVLDRVHVTMVTGGEEFSSHLCVREAGEGREREKEREGRGRERGEEKWLS